MIGHTEQTTLSGSLSLSGDLGGANKWTALGGQLSHKWTALSGSLSLTGVSVSKSVVSHCE